MATLEERVQMLELEMRAVKGDVSRQGLLLLEFQAESRQYHRESITKMNELLVEIRSAFQALGSSERPTEIKPAPMTAPAPKSAPSVIVSTDIGEL